MTTSQREEVDVTPSGSGEHAVAKSTTRFEDSTVAVEDLSAGKDKQLTALSSDTEGVSTSKPTLDSSPTTPSSHSITPPSPSSLASPSSLPSDSEDPSSHIQFTNTSEDAGGFTPLSELNPPYLLRYRSSTTFIAMTVALGVLVDLAGYGIVVPVIPFRLQAVSAPLLMLHSQPSTDNYLCSCLLQLGYDNIGAKVGWLVSAYAGGLIVSSPPIAYLGERIKGRRGPLIFGLMFMAGGESLRFQLVHSTS